MKAFCIRRVHGNSHRPQINPRVQMFLGSLPAARRAEIAARPRFYRIPWVRPAGEADSDPDDFLP